MSSRPHFVMSAESLLVSAGRGRAIVTSLALALAVVSSAAGLFLVDTSLRLGTGMRGFDILRLVHVLVLIGGLGWTAFHYAKKHHTWLDELALLVFLTCGVNLIIQITGGSRSYWQGLYLVLGGLASVGFSRRHVVALVLLVLLLETANWVVYPATSFVDLFRLSLLFLFAVVGYNYMERAERDRAERAEDRLLKLHTGLRQLEGPENELEDENERISPLSEEGQRAGRAEQVEKLDDHLEPLLALAVQATGARTAVLLQVGEEEHFYWVRLIAGEAEGIARRRLPAKGSLLSEVLRNARPITLESRRLEWRLAPGDIQSVLAVPIRIWDEPPWVLVLDHAAPGYFSEERRDMVCAIAEQMAEAQSLFRRQARQYVEELELKGLLRASESLSSSAHLVDLLRHLVNYAREVVHFDTCAVCLCEEGKETFNVVVAEGYRKEILGQSISLESPTWAGWVLRAREEPLAIRMERRSGMPILDSKEKPTTGASFLAIPLRAGKRVSGALFVTRTGDSFTARELRLLRIYLNHAAVAIENAIVYERVDSLAATDALTGLYNRRYLEHALAREIARADRTTSSLALLILDIDHFKSFNDTYGHTMGDIVLKRVASTLKDALRKGDVLGRFGGEEFVVLLPQVTPKGALESAERIRAAVAEASLHPGGPRRNVTVSIGLAMCPDHAERSETLIQAADRALYLAKERGRNRVCSQKDLSLAGV